MAEYANEKSLLQRLWDRRFFQYLATYLGVCWGLIQFSEWIVNRYGFDGSLIDKLALLLFGCLPAMVSFIYFHGAPGHDEWKRFEKVFYPINLILALGASMFLIDGSAQTTTRQIRIENESGDTVVRSIPKLEFTKRVVFFPFTSDLGEDSEWIEFAVPVLADLDIEQDMEWYSIKATALSDDIMDYGYDYRKAIPFSVKIKVAKDNYCDYFVEGNITNVNGSYQCDIKLIRVKDGKEIYNERFESNTIYGLSDQISVAVANKVGRKVSDEVKEFVDLPSSDLVTGNPDALKSYVNGLLNFNKDKQYYSQAYDDAVKSTTLDPNCAECFALKGKIGLSLGMDGRSDFNQAVTLSDNLPERQKFELKYQNYFANQDPDKAKKILDYWKTIYPQDITPFGRLIQLNSISLNHRKALDIAQEAMEAGHEGMILLRAADLAVRVGDLEKATEYVADYEQKYPEKAGQKSLLADVYSAKGDYEKAIEIYERNIILNPNNTEIYGRLVESYFGALAFEKGFKAKEDGLKACANFRDSIQYYGNIINLYAKYGMVDPFLQDYEEYKRLYFTHFPKNGFIQPMITKAGVHAGMEDFPKVDKQFEEIRQITPPAAQAIINMLLDYLHALFFEDKDAYPEVWAKVKDFMIASAGETAEIQGNLFSHYFAEDYEKTIDYIKEFGKLSGDFINNAAPLISECYDKLDREDEGIAYLKEYLETEPNDPAILVSLFRLYVASNNWRAANDLVDHVEKSLSYTHSEWVYNTQFSKDKEILAAQNE